MSTSILAFVLAVAAAQLDDGFQARVIREAYDRYTPAMCLVTYTAEITNPASGEATKRDNSALGLIVSPRGLVLAPGHMQLENSEPFNVSVAVGQGDQEKKYAAKLLKKPDDVNVCLMQLQAEDGVSFPYVRFTPGVTLQVGDPILLIGILSETMDFARGIVTTRVTAVLDKPRPTYPIEGAIRYGFVSGPVVDCEGRVIGVVGFDLTPSEGGDLYVRSGQPLVYQTDLFQKYIDAPPVETSEPAGEEAWLGIFTQPLNDDFAAYWGLEKRGGLIISSIVPGSPAETAGLKPGDVVTQFDSTPIRAKLDREVLGFTKLVRESRIGKPVDIEVLRDQQPIEFKITLVARPKSARDAGEYVDEVLGLTVRELTTDVRLLLNLSEDVKGVIVRRVKSGSVADLARMRPGIIIMNLGDHPVTTIDEFKAAVEQISTDKPDEVSAFCRAGAATGFFRLEPRWEDNAGK
jgi:serine protease Do